MSRSRLQSLNSNIDHMTCSLSSKNSPRNTVDFEAACSVYIRFRGMNGYACPPATTATAWIERRAPWARGSTSRRGSNQAGSHSRSVPTRPEERGAIRPIRAVLPPTPAYWPGRFGFDAGHSRTDGFRIRPTRLIERRLKSPLLPGKIDERHCILE